MLNFFFGFNGRVRRSSYFFGAIAGMCAWTVLCVSLVAAIAVANGAYIDPEAQSFLVREDVVIDGEPWMGIAFAVIALLGLWVSLALTVKRWHDVGQSGWFALLTLPPFANLMVFVLLCLLPGSTGENRFGRDPRGRTTRTEAPALA